MAEDPRDTDDPNGANDFSALNVKNAGKLVEFNALRREIDRRSNSQDAVQALQVTASATLAAVAIGHRSSAAILFLIGPLSLFLTLQWLDQHRVIARIGIYIRDNLEHRVGLGWENRDPEKRIARGDHWQDRVLWLSPMILLFAGLNILALVGVRILITSLGTAETAFWWIDLGLALVCTLLLLRANFWDPSKKH